MELLDPIVRDSSSNEIISCIHIGLLCVQENIAYRPSMASVVFMLSSYSTSIPQPLRPGFSNSTMEMETVSESSISDESKSGIVEVSIN